MPSLLALGTQICVYYTFTTKTRILEPNLIMADAHIVNDVAPEDSCAFDLLSDEGETKLREVVTAVKVMAARNETRAQHLTPRYNFVTPYVHHLWGGPGMT
jgi:predicted DNA binding protein